MLTKSLSTIQEKVESYYREMRTNLVRYDRIVDAQRRIFYERRQEVLTGDRQFLSKLLDSTPRTRRATRWRTPLAYSRRTRRTTKKKPSLRVRRRDAASACILPVRSRSTRRVA